MQFTVYESEKFTDSSLHHIFESEILGFLFLRKIRVKCEKLEFRKS